MEYKLIPQRLPTLNIILVVILWNIIHDYFGTSSTLFFILLLFVVILPGLTRFKFQIHDDYVIYQILYFKKSIFKKKIYPNQMEQIKFIRVGWAKKGAVIKVKKGLNYRLTILEPQRAYDELVNFANKHDIKVVKTKDYLLLEKYYSNNE